MIEAKSKIVITDDFEGIKEKFKEAIEPGQLVVIESDELKIEHAKEAVKEAYIASKEDRYILLVANRFNVYAQNALLKILEEPPKNSHFILVSRSKSTFLPTILSRLPVQKIDAQQAGEISFEQFDLEGLYELAKQKDITKTQAKSLIKGMLKWAMKQQYNLSQKELDYFGNAIKLIELNSNISNVLITAGLILLRHKKRGR